MLQRSNLELILSEAKILALGEFVSVASAGGFERAGEGEYFIVGFEDGIPEGSTSETNFRRLIHLIFRYYTRRNRSKLSYILANSWIEARRNQPRTTQAARPAPGNPPLPRSHASISPSPEFSAASDPAARTNHPSPTLKVKIYQSSTA